jgi:hypothetical protein
MIEDNGAELQMGVLKAADHKRGPPRRQWPNAARYFWSFPLFTGDSAATTGLMVFPAALVASQAFFNAARGLFRTVIRVWSHALCFKQRAGVKMKNAFRAETKTIPAYRRMARVAAAKIFRGRLLDPVGDFPLK